MAFLVGLLATIPIFAQDPAFIRGQDSRIHGVALDRTQEQTTRVAMRIKSDCGHIKKRVSALAFVGSEGASINLHTQSKRGVIVLEGLRTGRDPKILHTVLLSPYKNMPTSIPGETGMMPGSRYPLAITVAAQFAGEGDVVFATGDSLLVHADGQAFSYALPALTIPRGGLVRLYLGTDDTLYYDSLLTHPAHAGACRSRL